MENENLLPDNQESSPDDITKNAEVESPKSKADSETRQPEQGSTASDQSPETGDDETQTDTLTEAEETLTPEDSPDITQTRLDRIESTLNANMEALKKIQRSHDSFGGKLREISEKLDDITSSFSEPRIRELLLSLLLLHDLIDQMVIKLKDNETGNDCRQKFKVLLSQILQILEVHGIEVIPTDIPFDGNLHNAIKSIQTDDENEDGQICHVYRKGFRSKRRILRYAEVEVKTFVKKTQS